MANGPGDDEGWCVAIFRDDGWLLFISSSCWLVRIGSSGINFVGKTLVTGGGWQ